MRHLLSRRLLATFEEIRNLAMHGRRPLPAILPWLLACSSAASKTADLQECAGAVQLAYNYLTFAGNNTGPDYCSNQLKVDSIHASFTLRCDSRDLQVSVDLLNSYCADQALPPSTWVSDPAKVAELRVVEYGEYARKVDKITEPVLVSEAFHDRARRTLVGFASHVFASSAMLTCCSWVGRTPSPHIMLAGMLVNPDCANIS